MIGCPAPFVPLLTRIKIMSIANCRPDPMILNPLFDIAALQQNIAAGHLILTPNHRLARAIRSAWGEYCTTQQGQQRWPQPHIYAFESWLDECWQQLLDQCYEPALTGAVLSDQGATLLWRTAIENDQDAPADLDPSNFVRIAQQTWRDLQRWSIEPHQLAAHHHPGTQYFLRWLKHFQQALARRRLLTREDSYGIIIDGFADGALQQYARIITVGFQTTPPLFARVIDAAAGDVEHLQQMSSHNSAGTAYALGLQDENAEISAAAHWAKEQYRLNPHQRIGVVFSNLNRMRDKVERVFRDTFSPIHCLPHSPHGPASFNLSAGIPLRQTPVIGAALTLLTLHNSVPFTLEEYCALLNNQFWGTTTTDVVLRSHAELLLRKLGKVAPGYDDLRNALQQAQQDLGEHNANLAEMLHKGRQLARQRPRRALFSHWAEYCTQLLTALGWPGARPLDSIEYQQVERWRSVLEDMAALDHYGSAVTWGEALTELTQLANNAVFQPETPDSAVQVLGLLEAAGLRFDRLWVAGMDSNQWPQGVVYNPLLPPLLQRQWQLPRACPEQELTLAQMLFDQFAHSADQVLFSYPRMEGDTELRPSALLDPLQPCPSSAATEIDNSPETWALSGVSHAPRTQPALEPVASHSAPPLAPLPQRLRGGSGLLRDQAGCPFNAFAIWRLGATPLPEPQPGLSPQDRGTLVHRCLELLWRQLQSQANLLALDESALHAQVTEVIDQVLAPLQRRRPDLLGVRFSRLERQRLLHLLTSWLEIDRARPPFVVTPPEQETSITIGGLMLTLRMDRIDRLENGDLVLIDYKTGGASIKDWSGERPADPQLPLYALRAETPIAALCFARVSVAKDFALYGIAENSDLLPKLAPLAELALPATWADTLDHWRRVLTLLADEFCAGTTPIIFYNLSTQRNHSYLLPLNRYPEQQSLNDDVLENDSPPTVVEYHS